jgi:hypothetical protein
MTNVEDPPQAGPMTNDQCLMTQNQTSHAANTARGNGGATSDVLGDERP